MQQTYLKAKVTDSSNDVLSRLRFPLAAGVVFIHSYGNKMSAAVLSSPWSGYWFYELIRNVMSAALPNFAVPMFFLISGYFFFLNMPRWDWRLYGQKLRRRVGTLLIPYILWNILYALHISWPTLGPAIMGHGSWSRWLAQLQGMGGWHMLWDSRHFGSGATGPVLGPLWFLRDLIVIDLAVPLLYAGIRKLRWYFSAIMAVLSVCQWWIPLHGFSEWATLWFVLGSTFSIERLSIRRTLRPWRLPAAIGAVAMCVLITFLHLYNGSVDRWIRLLYIVPAMATAFNVCDWLMRRGVVRERKWAARSTMFIYLSHIFFLTPIMRFVKGILPHGSSFFATVGYILVPLLTVAVCVAVYNLYFFCRGVTNRFLFTTNK